VPLDPPAVILSLIMLAAEAPPEAAAGPALATPDRPVTPNVIGAETIPDGSVTRPASENTSSPIASMLLPTGFAAATAEVEKSPVTQLPAAEAVELMVPPKKGLRYAHGTDPVLAEVKPLPPSLVRPNPHPAAVGPADEVAEKVSARARGEPSTRQITHNAERPSDGFIAIPVVPFRRIK
jgi:hypothetical protein